MNLNQLLIVCATASLSSIFTNETNGQIAPSYTSIFEDATVNGSYIQRGETHWFVPEGADQYSNDRYERPTTQSYKTVQGRFATDSASYWENLDIKTGSFGFDDHYLYLRIELVGERRSESDGGSEREGLIHEYGVRINTDPNGAYGYLFIAEEPSKQSSGFGLSKNFGYVDADGNANRNGNGYEKEIIADGEHKSNGRKILYSRIDPTNSSAVEFALKHADVGINPATISSVVFEANKGLKGPSNYPWNKKYGPSDAGSPNPGTGGYSEFGTSGLGDIYELDTLKGFPDSNNKLNAVPPTGKIKIPYTVYRRGTSIRVGFEIQREAN